uniref:Uncharacterized protein n=1 Tax=Sus scrofa TaxID=9823 RepID=A0A480FNV8_PIG
MASPGTAMTALVIAGISTLLGPACLRLPPPRCSCWCGGNPLRHRFPPPLARIAICAFRISSLPVLQEGVRTFLSLDWTRSSRSGQRRAKSKTPDFGLGTQTGPVFSDPRIQPLLHELFRSVRILCISFLYTCAPGRHGGRQLGMPGRRAAGGSAGSHPGHRM